jgi:hypothetical protein
MTDIIQELRLVECAGDVAPKDHAPLAGRAADEIERLRTMLKHIVDIYDSGDLQMSSPDVDGLEDKYNDPYPPHPWHEEWISRARDAIK